jgi:ComF family protein
MLKDTFAPLVDLVYPPRCPLCGEGIGAQNGLCPACWAELAIPPEHSCVSCQEPLAAGEVGIVCPQCQDHPPAHDGITAAAFYTEAAKRLVVSYKHGRKIGLAPLLARLVAARLPELAGEWLVVPVPLHRWRLWQRGFNQSALLAVELAKLRGQRLLVDALVRRRNTASLSQGRLGRAERARLLAGAIAVNPARATALKGAQVLLVDDVVTSGATTDACLAALREAGARTVRIACFARVPNEQFWA